MNKRGSFSLIRFDNKGGNFPDLYTSMYNEIAESQIINVLHKITKA